MEKAIHIKIFSFFFLVLYSASILKVYLPFVNYYLNYTYISTTLCENKDKPEMHCNGKCHLQKTIEENQETKSKEAPAASKISVFHEVPVRKLNVEFKERLDAGKQIAYIIQRYSSPESEILSPPPQSCYIC